MQVYGFRGGLEIRWFSGANHAIQRLLFDALCMNVEYQQVSSLSLSHMLRVCKIKKLDLTASLLWFVVPRFCFCSADKATRIIGGGGSW